MNCTVCSNPQVNVIDALLGGGTSIRSVSRMFGHSRSAVARHKQHAQVSASRLSLIRGQGGPGGTGGPLDPMTAALELSAKARTDREQLKAAEAVRSATALAVRALRGGDLDEDMLERLDANVVRAANLYRQVGGFENELRGLAGHREAIRQRLEVARGPEQIEVPMTLATAEGEPIGEATTLKMPAAQYWAGVPARYRDLERYVVERVLQLQLGSAASRVEVKVREIGRDVVAWTSR